jgi:hypothetical protein
VLKGIGLCAGEDSWLYLPLTSNSAQKQRIELGTGVSSSAIM